MLEYAIFAVAFVVFLIAAVIYLYPGSSKPSSIPGLNPTTEEDGNVSDIARAGSLHEFLLDLHKRFGSIASFWIGQKFVVSIHSPELFKQHQNVFDRPLELFKLFEPFYGATSVMYANGKDGRYRRYHYDKPLSHESLKQYYSDFQEIANELEKKWSTLVKEEQIPLWQYMSDFALKCWDDLERSLTKPIQLGSQRQKVFKEVLTWCFYFLATHPEIQDKVYKEIKKELGNNDVDFQSINDLSYTRQVLDETFRCAVIAPWAARFQDSDSELGGLKIPKGTLVIHALGVSLNDEKYWPLPNKLVELRV